VSLPGCCDASTAADGQSLPAAAPLSATLQFSSARVPAGSASASRRKVEGPRPAAVAGRSGSHRGSPVFLLACGVPAEEASQRGPLPLTSRRSLAGWGGEVVLPYRSRSRSFALEPVRLPPRARVHACARSVFCTPALHCTLQRGSVVSAPGSNRGLTHWLT
jgi:hypothetical protein